MEGRKSYPRMDELSDEAIMERVKAGETGRLDLLVYRYEKPLHAYAFRIMGNRAAAEDAFQETFLKLLRSREQYRVGALVRPGLYQICLNVCRDALRKNSRRPQTVELSPILPLPDPSEGPEELSQQAALSAHVRAAVEELPEKHREVFLLAFYQELPYSEIAEILDIAVGTVKSRVFMAHRKLSSTLSEFRPT